MKISKEQVEKIAALVRLELQESEKEAYASDLASILGYVEKLGEVDTKSIEISNDGLSNVLSEDKAEPCDISREELLKNAPMTEGGFIKVKSVLE